MSQIVVNHHSDGLACVEIAGQLAGPECQEMISAVENLVLQGSKNIIVDLPSAKWVNSLGMGSIVSEPKSEPRRPCCLAAT
jgi:anti-anti-sigma regulatory factor